ncbi:MAG: DEAD/DEAH box helicase [Alphaproteobacteria bacterium]|nr:DEAD/DEAH box helicase [Alphaproteobacteria bacterium]
MTEHDDAPTEGAASASADDTTAAPKGADYVSDRDFADFPIREETLRGILEMGFSTATPVQAQSIDPAIAGKDMIVRAKTGTGKTAAFMVPIIERTPDGTRKPFALVLEPTRELAQQTAEQAEAIAKYRDVGVVTLVGGLAMGPQEQALAAGAEILVGTPGRVLDHIRRGNLDASAITMVCLDEADEMLSMGFYEDVTSIIDATNAERQVLLFSATISDDTQRIVQRYLHDPLDVRLSTDADGVELIEHVLYDSSAEMHRVRALLYVIDIEDPTSAIIFCNTREDTATVATFLDRQGLDAQLISGELSQARRTQVMDKVKAGEVRFLVATDVAARGIDISDLSHVINYHLPQDPAVYLHRTGRTGRIGKKGTAISIVGGTDLSTRKILETRHKIPFVQRELPSAEDAVRMRVERQARQIKKAMGSLVFESYLPTVRALMERPDGTMLLAAALRAFFTWDRERRAAASGLSTVEAVIEARNAKLERRESRDDDRGGRRKGRRGERNERGDRGDRGDRSDRSDRPERSERRDKRERKPEAADLDALLDVDDAAPPAAETDGKRKRKRSRRKKGGSDSAPEATAAKPELDALLELDDAPPAAADTAPPADAPKPKAKSKAKPKAKKPDTSDLDDLLELD